jgi:hypothetical protein
MGHSNSTLGCFNEAVKLNDSPRISRTMRVKADGLALGKRSSDLPEC